MIWRMAGSLLWPVLTGYLLTLLLLPRRGPRWASEIFRVCLGAGLGVGLSGSLYFLILLLVGPSTIVCLLTELGLMACLAAGCWLRPGSSAAGAAGDQVFNPVAFHWLLLTALLAALALAVPIFLNAVTTNPYGNWDALAVWNLRAKFLAENDPFWKSAFSPLLSHTHPDYPLLLSGYIARCWRLTDSIGDVVIPVGTAALFLFATVGLLVSALFTRPNLGDIQSRRRSFLPLCAKT